MQIENDYDKEVYNGDIRLYRRRLDPEAGELVASFDGRSVTPTASANSTRWFPPMPPPSTRVSWL